MNPQDYAARTAYRPPAAWYRRRNWIGVLLTSLGLAPRDTVTLQVRGRSSGKLRRIPILRTRVHGDDYLVALAGESQWVRNVRAADGHAVRRRRRARHVRLVELPPGDRRPLPGLPHRLRRLIAVPRRRPTHVCRIGRPPARAPTACPATVRASRRTR